MKKFGCFISAPDQIYNNCILDDEGDNSPSYCSAWFKNRYNAKKECSYWREIKEPFRFVDRNDIEAVRVCISSDKKTLWVNTEKGCILRLQNIKEIIIDQME